MCQNVIVVTWAYSKCVVAASLNMFSCVSCRSLITTALAAYVERGNSCFGTVRCLDGIGASGVVGFLWKKYVGDKTAVTINDPRTKAYEGIKHNAELNVLTVEILNRDPCALLHEQTYHFV